MTGPRENVVQAACCAVLIEAGFVDVGAEHWDGTLPAGCPGVFWRNNTGTFKGANGAPVKAGCPGSADLFIIPRGGRFTPVECKRTVGGRASDDQLAWHGAVNELGANGKFVKSAAEMRALVKEMVR